MAMAHKYAQYSQCSQFDTLKTQTVSCPWLGRTDSYLQMKRLSLRNNQLKYETSGELPIILEKFIEYTPI